MSYPVAKDRSGGPLVLEIHDADTFRLALTLEHEAGLLYAPWLRLAGCNAPETYAPGGPEARNWVINRLSLAREITVELHGWSFDRRVADVWLDGRSLTEWIIDAGHAVGV